MTTEFKLNFKDGYEIQKFSKMNNYEQSEFIATQLKDYVKISTPVEGNVIYYIYDMESKLWKMCSQKTYNGIMAKYFYTSSKQVKDTRKDVIKLLDDDESISEIKAVYDKVLKDFDSIAYINKINERLIYMLSDNEFCKTLNTVPHIFPLKNGKKINFKTLEVSERTKDDLCTFECNLDYKDDVNDDVEKYFYQLIPNKKNRRYLQKALGYMLTGETLAQVFFVLYGVGENGKSQIMKFMNAILKEFL